MKKNIVKTMLKAAATTTMVAAMFVGGNTLEAKAYNMNGDVANMTMVEYVNLYTTGQLPKATAYNCSMTTKADEDALLTAMTMQIVNTNVNIVSDSFSTTGCDDAIVAETGVSGTAGVATSNADMLALVNADRTATTGAPALVWDADLEAYALQRVVEVTANFQSPEFAEAKANGGDIAKIGHRGRDKSKSSAENAARYYSAETIDTVNAGWINSTGHHNIRTKAKYTKYACASYADPTTGEMVYIELFK